MKDLIKLPVEVFTGETCSEAKNHNASVDEHYIATAQIFDDPSSVTPKLNRTAFLQSINLQTEKIRKSINLNDCK